MEKNVALLIDAENISHKYINTILSELEEFGNITIKRVYKDYNVNSDWKDECIKFGLSPVHQFTHSKVKNTNDFSLIIDAMELLLTKDIDTYCIVSSDSDFNKLVTKIREYNKEVIGMGESKTRKELVNNYDQFIVLDRLLKDVSTDNSSINIEEEQSEVLLYVNNLIDNYSVKGFANFSKVMEKLRQKYKDFDPRNFGGKNKKPRPFFESFDYIFETREKTLMISSGFTSKETDLSKLLEIIMSNNENTSKGYYWSNIYSDYQNSKHYNEHKLSSKELRNKLTKLNFKFVNSKSTYYITKK